MRLVLGRASQPGGMAMCFFILQGDVAGRHVKLAAECLDSTHVTWAARPMLQPPLLHQLMHALCRRLLHGSHAMHTDVLQPVGTSLVAFSNFEPWCDHHPKRRLRPA